MEKISLDDILRQKTREFLASQLKTSAPEFYSARKEGKIRAGLAYAFLRTKGFENVKVLNASLDDIASLERP